MRTLATLFLLALISLRAPAWGPAESTLDEHLEPFRPFLGKTWKGHFKNSTPEKPVVDVSRWERALNGKAIRVLHSVNDGVYGGETIILWDVKKQDLVYFYFTTASYFTQGTMEIKDGQFLAQEAVTGSAEGITEVRSRSVLLPDGRIHLKSEYLKKGEWVPGHEITYSEAPDAKVVFK